MNFSLINNERAPKTTAVAIPINRVNNILPVPGSIYNGYIN